MTTYPDLMKEPKLLKMKTRDDQLKDLRYRSEKHDYENIIKSLKIDNEYFKNYIRI